MTSKEQVRLLFNEEGPQYISFDDDELYAAARLRRKRQRIRSCLWISCGVFIVALVGSVLFIIAYFGKAKNSSSTLDKYMHAAVASDVTQCSEIGRDILQKSGGNAVDAALAALLCMALADPQSMGLGGGFFMTVYNRTTGKSYSIDARETAPAASTRDMFYNGISSTIGGLAIGVPGEVLGYQKAHDMFGSVPWQQLFEPAIEMASKGFSVPKSLEYALQDFQDSYNDQDLKTLFPQFGKTFFNSATGKLFKEGETIRMPELARTLTVIAKEGADAFYNGSLIEDILSDMSFNNSGSIITAEDLRKYSVKIEESLAVELSDSLKMYAPRSPSSGAILAFILNILNGYNMTSQDLQTVEQRALVYHRIIEAFKFGYARRTEMADVKFYPSVEQLINNLTSQSYADSIRAQIWDNQTHSYQYYGPVFQQPNKTGTAHLSVIDQFGNAVAVTSTINTRFGAKMFGKKTGIIWNNEMNDFATTNKPDEFNLYPSPANEIVPGKRPISSMCPAIFVDSNGDVKMVLGAAGGSRITSATAFVAAQVLWFNNDINEAIDQPRIHHQLLPPVFTYEPGFEQAVVESLKAKGHNSTQVSTGLSIVQGITRKGQYLYASSDRRKGGTPAGF